MESNLRVHISPVGFDPAGRVTGPLLEYRADRVYLVSKSKSDSASDRMAQVRKTLEKHRHIEVHEVYVNIWDLFSCLEKLREIFEKEKASHVFVNVSTGSKIVSIAGMIACMLWRGTPYYARLDYDGTGPSASAASRQVVGTDLLPVYEITKPTKQSLALLAIVAGAGGRMSKKQLIDRLEEARLIAPRQASETKSAAHSRLRAILDPLESHWHFVEVSASGRSSVVTLTEQGMSALRIFGGGSSAGPA